jgi:hypothetical protein
MKKILMILFIQILKIIKNIYKITILKNFYIIHILRTAIKN